MVNPTVGGQVFGLNAGRLCLDFANTAEWHASERPEEHLNAYADLVSWSKQAGLLADRQSQRLLQQAARHPAHASTALDSAVALREAIYKVFSAMAHGQQPAPADLDTLNAAIGDSMARSRIVATKEGFIWGWGDGEDTLDLMLWPVARSAADLLTSDERRRVGQCADDRGCGWLFLDTSRNHSRRWCDMRDCGNRAKARRHYQRARRR